MPKCCEHLLYFLAKRLYRSESAFSAEMQDAVADPDSYCTYRAAQIDRLCSTLSRLGIHIRDRVVLDLGCGDGALTAMYLKRGARRVVGVDVDAKAIAAAQKDLASPDLEFHLGTVDSIPLSDRSLDVVVCYDVFEHLADPAAMLGECHRVLCPAGRVLIGTWGWYHPYAPHLWSVMPVPWAHVFFSERTILHVCRRVYESPWYVPTTNDLDETGRKKGVKFSAEEISPEYLNKLLIRDYEELFRASRFAFRVHPEPFKSWYARWTRVLLRVPLAREFITAYIWVDLEKPAGA